MIVTCLWQAMVMVAWPEGIHHVLALPQDQQSDRQVGQGQNKQSSEHANSTVLQTQDRQISNPDNTKGGGLIGEHFKKRLLTARNHLKLFHQVEFWECFTHPAYTDLDLIMQDGRLPVNRLMFQCSKFSYILCFQGIPSCTVPQSFNIAQPFHWCLDPWKCVSPGRSCILLRHQPVCSNKRT